MSNEKKQALLVIDVQVGIARGKHIHAGWPAILGNIVDLIVRARARNIPVIFLQHDGEPGDRLQPGSEGWALCPELGVLPSDIIVRKTASDSFFNTRLESTLREQGIQRLIVAGCMTEYCVDTTVRRAVSLGFDVTLAADAHGTWNSPALDAAKIIEHHNGLLDQFSAGCAAVSVTPVLAVVFS
jgi:nicotinamidase-related amidase